METTGSGAGKAARERRFSFEADRRVRTGAPSGLLRALKLILPVAAALLVMLLIAWPQFRDVGPGSAVPKVRMDDADDVRMRNARYVGTDSEGRPFTVTATTTRQVGADSRQLDLEKPQADIKMENGRSVAVMATRGLYDREANTLSLSGDVQLQQDQGYTVRTDRARVNLKDGVAVGDGPVTAEGPAGTLTGEGFRVEEEGKRVMVTGRSYLQIFPSALKEQK